MSDRPATEASSGYQLFMLVLCVFALAALAANAAIELDPRIRDILRYADYAVCGVFFVDFAAQLLRAKSRWRYFASWGWIDLISSIPAIDIARLGRLARILRILRVLRGLRATRLLTTIVLRRRAENTFLATSLVALLLIISCSVGVLHVETGPEANIRTAEDAIWWAFATITTVGYGDCYPVTAEGRLIAAILMCSGVGLFGAFSGFLAAWFLSPEEAARESELDRLRREIADLRALLERRFGEGSAPQEA